MSVMTRWNNDDIASNFMTKEQVKRECPLAFMTEPTRNVSGKYIVATTETVIDDMERLGWKVVEAHQRKASKRSEDGQQFSYHQIIFQNPDIKITKTSEDGTEVVDCYPRILLGNSYDGCNAFRFTAGLLRLVCSNGLVVATDKSIDIRIIHVAYTMEELKQVINKAVEDLPGQVQIMNRMREVQLTEAQKNQFALDTIKIRKGIALDDDSFKVDDETIAEILDPVREEDKSNDLWTVFNVLQEKMIRGGFSTSDEGKKPRKVRAVTSFITDMKLNQQLFATASAYLPAVAA